MTVLIQSAIKLLVDVVLLVAVGLAFGRRKEPRYVKLILGSLLVALGYLAYDKLPRWMLGYLFVVPLMAAAAWVLVMYGRMRWKRAALASAGLCAVHFVVRFFA